MSLRITELPKFDSVEAGKPSIATLTRGRGYHCVRVDASDAAFNTVEDIIETVEVLVNGKPQRSVAPDRLNAINTSRAAFMAKVENGTAGVDLVTSIPIWFATPDRKDAGSVTAGVWNNNGVDSVQIKVKTKSTSTTPSLSIWGEWEPSDKPLGLIEKWYSSNPPITGGVLEMVNQHLNTQGDRLQAMHFFPTSDGKYVETLKIKINGEEWRDTLSKFRNAVALLGREMSPDITDAPRYDFVVDYDDPIRQWLPLAGLKSFDVRAVLNAQPTAGMEVVTIRVGTPD